MIFLTVGSQLPFDRLVRAMDQWCARSPRPSVFGQIGDPGRRGYRPRNFEWGVRLSPKEFDDLADRADLLVAHAGMGSIISALTRAKPIVIMPRRSKLGEHRNDHQQATADRFANRPGVYVTKDESELSLTVDRALAEITTSNTSPLPAYADQALIDVLRCFILSGASQASDE